MDYKKEIIKKINLISGKYSAYEVFTDWIRCCSIVINNSCQLFRDKVWKDRETLYLDTLRKYTREEVKIFVEMMSLLTLALEEEITDILGQIYMESGMGSKAAGQFFTPFHLSKLCAAMTVPDPDENGKIIINEPSCGGGGMIIAAAAALGERGVDFQRVMKVTAQDLDWKGVYMCYLQLSLLGIDAICVQGNTLLEPYQKGYPEERILRTPKNRGIDSRWWNLRKNL